MNKKLLFFFLFAYKKLMNDTRSIKTIVLSELPKNEKVKYFQFLLDNDINFSKDDQGNYIALVKVLNPQFYNDVDAQQERLREENKNKPRQVQNIQGVIQGGGGMGSQIMSHQKNFSNRVASGNPGIGGINRNMNIGINSIKNNNVKKEVRLNF